MLAVRLSKDLEERLERLAQKTNRTKSFYVKKALEQYLEDEEDYQDAVSAYEEYLKSGKQSVSFEELMEKNGFQTR
jgi:RHH-type rel operon transcriptional repressor/antitoxin RelB